MTGRCSPQRAQTATHRGFHDQHRDITINVSTHDVDLTQLYGSNRTETEALRAHEGGLLKSEGRGGELFPPRLCDESGQIKPEFKDAPVPVKFDELPPEQRRELFAMGSDAANSQLGYAMLNVLFLREHNRIAQELAARNPAWGDDDDRLFETARNVLTVLLIKLAIEQYINHIAPYHFKFRLDPTGFYDQICSNPRVRDELRRLYGSVDRIEFYVGLFAEDRRPNSVLPSLVGRMVRLHALSQLAHKPAVRVRGLRRGEQGEDLLASGRRDHRRDERPLRARAPQPVSGLAAAVRQPHARGLDARIAATFDADVSAQGERALTRTERARREEAR